MTNTPSGTAIAFGTTAGGTSAPFPIDSGLLAVTSLVFGIDAGTTFQAFVDAQDASGTWHTVATATAQTGTGMQAAAANTQAVTATAVAGRLRWTVSGAGASVALSAVGQ